IAQSGERFGPSHIIDILRGQETQKIMDKAHNRLASFGAGTARKKNEWQSLIGQLVAGGFLTLDIGGHGGLSIAEKGHRLVRGEGAFLYRVEPPRGRARGKGRADQMDGLPAGDPALLAALKALRLRLAKERQVPAYVIFSDRTLADMAARCPRDLDAFAEVN